MGDIGPIKGGQTMYCAASSQYTGPCDSESYTFEQMTENAKTRWSNMCQAYWPCVNCDRDYQAVCPQGWMQTEDELSSSPPPMYKGSCRGTMNFTGYNKNMLEHWSSLCGVEMPCFGFVVKVSDILILV